VAARRHRIAPRNTHRARDLRRDATFPERLLWSRVRGGGLAGLKFRRQQAIGPFVVDFYCAAAALVIEIDGLTHVGRGAEAEQRSEYLSREGLRVLQYTNDDVLSDVGAVAEDIARQAGVDWWSPAVSVRRVASAPATGG